MQASGGSRCAFLFSNNHASGTPSAGGSAVAWGNIIFGGLWLQGVYLRRSEFFASSSLPPEKQEPWVCRSAPTCPRPPSFPCKPRTDLKGSLFARSSENFLLSLWTRFSLSKRPVMVWVSSSSQNFGRRGPCHVLSVPSPHFFFLFFVCSLCTRVCRLRGLVNNPAALYMLASHVPNIASSFFDSSPNVFFGHAAAQSIFFSPDLRGRLPF